MLQYERRFWAKVERTPFSDECWLWKASCFPNGYGQFDHQTAHRVAWKLANRKEIPSGLVVRHMCHNPKCCNPKHLILGTSAENSNDMKQALRQAKGSMNGRSKLSETQVVEIKQLLRKGISQSKIAERFGVSQNAISHIKTGKNWRYLK
jgi:predicted XRE-type DNA-binding protein